MSDSPECRKCGAMLECEDAVWWRCPEKTCEAFGKQVIPAADAIDEAEYRFEVR